MLFYKQIFDFQNLLHPKRNHANHKTSTLKYFDVLATHTNKHKEILMCFDVLVRNYFTHPPSFIRCQIMTSMLFLTSATPTYVSIYYSKQTHCKDSILICIYPRNNYYFGLLYAGKCIFWKNRHNQNSANCRFFSFLDFICF